MIAANGPNAAPVIEDGSLHKATFWKIAAACSDSTGSRLILLEHSTVRLLDLDKGFQPLLAKVT